ncbi:hypothetical protein EXN37_08495 [Clostridium botulinum]|nr:hypothetical protein [Clostridium botulinum]NFD97771.1 hypothetical protein [Clostridium botulinum]NFJ83157.1 hypothetical protein [Clostridium botulinum]
MQAQNWLMFNISYFLIGTIKPGFRVQETIAALPSHFLIVTIKLTMYNIAQMLNELSSSLVGTI